jgi:hypothetical protein
VHDRTDEIGKRENVSTFDYMTPGEAVAAAREDAPDYRKIVGLKVVEADRLDFPPSRTPANNSRKPEPSGREHSQLDLFREVARVVWSSQDGSGEEADPGTITVTFTDGETTYLHRGDLLCVERPILTPVR